MPPNTFFADRKMEDLTHLAIQYFPFIVNVVPATSKLNT